MSITTLNNNWTHIGVLIDRSGSMQTLNPTNTSQELTKFIQDQGTNSNTDNNQKVTVTIARFDDEYEVIVKNGLAKDTNITAADIQPRNMTALYESFSRLIDEIGDELSEMSGERPGKIIIVVLTDGEENASKGIYQGEAGRKLLMEKITHQKEKYNWVFFFMGTNIDALATGKNIGIDIKTCINFGATQQQCSEVLRTTSTQVNAIRNLSQDIMMNKEKLMDYAGYSQLQRDTCK
jgi:hypothetical protein